MTKPRSEKLLSLVLCTRNPAKSFYLHTTPSSMERRWSIASGSAGEGMAVLGLAQARAPVEGLRAPGCLLWRPGHASRRLWRRQGFGSEALTFGRRATGLGRRGEGRDGGAVDAVAWPGKRRRRRYAVATMMATLRGRDGDGDGAARLRTRG
jgi:hypothetical protein